MEPRPAAKRTHAALQKPQTLNRVINVPRPALDKTTGEIAKEGAHANVPVL